MYPISSFTASRLFRDILASHDHLAFGGVEEPADQAQRGGLAGSVGAHESEDLAGRDVER